MDIEIDVIVEELLEALAHLRTHLDEAERAIMRLPLPSAEMGDGPQERVSHALAQIEQLQGQLAACRLVVATASEYRRVWAEEQPRAHADGLRRLSYVRDALFAAVDAVEPQRG